MNILGNVKMSTTQGRIRKLSPSLATTTTTKQGPMKATIPVASLLRQSHTTSLRKSKSNSPTLSPTSTYKTIYDQSSGQRSPGSVNYKVKWKTSVHGGGDLSDGSAMRRTASLDTIYLKGQWPRDSFYMYTGYLQVDKATQGSIKNVQVKAKFFPSLHGFRACSPWSGPRPTSPETMKTWNNAGRKSLHTWLNSLSTEEWPTSECRKSHRLIECNDDKLKLIRHRLQRNAKESGARLGPVAPPPSGAVASQTVDIVSSVLTSKVKPLAPRPPMRNSIEGLNQEIEKLVLRASTCSGLLNFDRCDSDKKTPEGHRAPLADLLRSTRSVNTQTPAASDLIDDPRSSGRSSRSSDSPSFFGRSLDESRPSSEQDDSQGSSPDHEANRLGTSPHINFLAREPPDGCEKVNLKFVEDVRMARPEDVSKPCVVFQLRPSLGSAFLPLQPMSAPEREIPDRP